MSSELLAGLNQKALELLKEDSAQIAKLIELQMATLTNRRCPLYEEVLDTQMYGLSREVDFAIRAGLVDENTGKQILSELESNLTELYEALNKSNTVNKD